jgi:Methyltransferase domain
MKKRIAQVLAGLLLVIAVWVIAALAPWRASAYVPGGHQLRWYAYRLNYYGDNHQCNLCGMPFRKFKRDRTTNMELECPFCRSRPRHRTAFIYFSERTDLFDGKPKRMLHVAPEASLGPKFKAARNIDYLSSDLNPARLGAMVKMDITDIQYPDNSFDVIYCSHVLEHVPDDRKAMRELARVLKPSGWAILAVPILREKTFEDPNVTSDADRERVYGQRDHVRVYGPDFADRLRESGFDVTVDSFPKTFSEEMVRRHGLSRADMYFCRKQSVAR